ncbi:BrnA antitoxin family protein [Acidiferrobacter sp.]|uniref:BrnA antitoxin family protein n=1 Tax=Acidiferrobacter sp. TaxID=1872107 RepID=UPI00345C3A81
MGEGRRAVASPQKADLRIDAEALEFFKHAGKRYRSRTNAVLRPYVEAHKAHTKRSCARRAVV